MNISFNRQDLAKIEESLKGIENGARTVLARAINKGADGVKPETKKVLAIGYNFKAKAINKQIKKPPRATVAKIASKVIIGEDAYGSGKGTSIIDFKGGRFSKKKGYSVKIKRSKIVIAKAFKIKLKTKRVIVAISDPSHPSGFKEIFTTSVVDASSGKVKSGQIEKAVGLRIDKELIRQTDLMLK